MDYTGNIGIILTNLGSEDFLVEPNMRLAQMVLKRVEQIEWEPVDGLKETERGSGGFGSTGIK